MLSPGRRLTRARHMAEIARRSLEGESQPKIAAALGISQSQVSRSLSLLSKRWLKEAKVDRRLERARDLATLDAVQEELFAAWQASKETEHVVRTVERAGANPSTTRSIRSHRRVGTPGFLRLFVRAVAQQSELFGLYRTVDAKDEWRRERALELREAMAPFEALEVDVVRAELIHRHGIIDIWLVGQAPPRPEELPPGFRPDVYPELPSGLVPEEEGGWGPCAGE